MKIAYIGNKRTDGGRFLAKFLVGDGCWNWTEGLFDGGYGAFNVGKGPVQAHRFAYEFFKKEKVPQGMVVMHTCDNRRCVNPSHLRAGTQSENCQDRDDKLRGFQSSKLSCKHGHPYDEANTGIRQDNGYRYCKTCTAGWNAEYKRRKAEGGLI